MIYVTFRINLVMRYMYLPIVIELVRVFVVLMSNYVSGQLEWPTATKDKCIR